MFSRIEDHVSLIWGTLLVKFWKDCEGYCRVEGGRVPYMREFMQHYTRSARSVVEAILLNLLLGFYVSLSLIYVPY